LGQLDGLPVGGGAQLHQGQVDDLAFVVTDGGGDGLLGLGVLVGNSGGCGLLLGRLHDRGDRRGGLVVGLVVDDGGVLGDELRKDRQNRSNCGQLLLSQRGCHVGLLVVCWVGVLTAGFGG